MKPIPPLPQSLTPPSTPVLQTAPETCSLCLSAPPEHVCACESTGVVLCVECISLHASKMPEKEHMMLPLKARLFVGRPGYVERLKLRQNSLKESIANMKKSISLVQSCKSQLQNRVENLILSVTTYRNTNTEKLTKYEDFLQQSLELVNQEIVENIYNEDYMPLSPYAIAVWTSSMNQEYLFVYKNSGKYKVKMGMRLNRDLSLNHISLGKKSKTRIQKPTPLIVPEEVPNSIDSFDPSCSVAYVCKNQLYLYGCSNGGNLARLAVPTQITACSSILMLPSGSIVISGLATPIAACAFEVCFKTGSISQLSDMLTPRYGHGTTYSNGLSYVFGGTSLQGLTSNCEALAMDSKQWHPLANLQQARDYFSPCLYINSVFIIGGRKAVLCEQYSIPENTFTLLPFQVPEEGKCISLITSTSLLYFQKTNILKLSLESMQQTQRIVMQAPRYIGWSVQNPILIGHTLFFVKSPRKGVMKVELPAEALE